MGNTLMSLRFQQVMLKRTIRMRTVRMMTIRNFQQL